MRSGATPSTFMVVDRRVRRKQRPVSYQVRRCVLERIEPGASGYWMTGPRSCGNSLKSGRWRFRWPNRPKTLSGFAGSGPAGK